MWVNAASNESMYLDPLCYGYTLDDNERLVADICSLELPDDFPLPCTLEHVHEKLYAHVGNQLRVVNTVNVQNGNVETPGQLMIRD